MKYLPSNKYVMVEYDEIEKSVFRSLWQETADKIKEKYPFECLDIVTAIESAEGDVECFKFLLESFRDTSDKNKADIQGSFEEKDFANYTIFVHALKSTSKMIGAEKLSEQARLLEMAGKKEDIHYIVENHQKVMELYEEALEEIRDYLGGKTGTKEDVTD